MIPELAVRKRACPECLTGTPVDGFCPQCGLCDLCCACKMIAVRGNVSRPAYEGQYTDDFCAKQRRLRAIGVCLMAAAIATFVFLWKIGVLR